MTEPPSSQQGNTDHEHQEQQPEPAQQRAANIARHWLISIALFVLFACLDAVFTLRGMNGNIDMEGNPVMKWFMLQFGLIGGLVVGKGGTLAIAAIIAAIGIRGIAREAPWVYWFTLTPVTKAWMQRKKRYAVAFLPIYLVAVSQMVAVAMWSYLAIAHGI